MRTLLNEVLPPQCIDEPMFSPSQPATPAQRTFSQPAVLAISDDLVEVGLVGTVMATPSTGAEQAKPALERGMPILETPGASNAAKSDQPGKVTPSA